MVWVTADLIENTRVTISNGRHTILSDEPETKGGEDTGPAPYELLLASLASCTLITLQLYARHKGITLEGVTARYEHEKREDVDASGRKQVVDVFTSEVEIAGDFSDAQRERLEQIVRRCRVHKTLIAGSEIDDRVRFV